MPGEFDLIHRYFEAATAARTDVVLGVGDDCALLRPPPGRLLAVSTDTLVSGHHFAPEVNPEALGHKALAVNLSDLAAMGAEPAWASLAITLPSADEAWLAAFMRGFSSLADAFGVALVGGDTTAGPLSVTLTVQGFVDAVRSLRRDAACPGDGIYVSGTLGDAGLALRVQQGVLDSPPVPELQARLDRPTPRVQLGLQLREFCRCAIDVSDGLGADLGHVCQRSGVGARLELAKIPLSDPVRAYLQATADWSVPLTSGDDYELLFTVPAAQRSVFAGLAAGLATPVTRIGEVVEAGQGIQALTPDGSPIPDLDIGYDHFRT